MSVGTASWTSLPDISIAEEAQDNRHVPGCQTIFDLIVSQPGRWGIMDDYPRSTAPETTIPHTCYPRSLHHDQ